MNQPDTQSNLISCRSNFFREQGTSPHRLYSNSCKQCRQGSLRKYRHNKHPIFPIRVCHKIRPIQTHQHSPDHIQLTGSISKWEWSSDRSLISIRVTYCAYHDEKHFLDLPASGGTKLNPKKNYLRPHSNSIKDLRSQWNREIRILCRSPALQAEEFFQKATIFKNFLKGETSLGLGAFHKSDEQHPQ